MLRSMTLLFLVAFGLSLQAAEPVFKQPPIKVPSGYTVELAAAPPLIGYPMMATFDDRGRLYIAESTGVNMRPADLEAKLPNLVRMLEDTDGDGRFDRSTVFADKMTQPMGAVYYRGALYVASPPSIWRLEDTDGDGVADKRDVLVDSFGYNGNAASIHGCFLGPCGRLYWTDGRHGHEFRDEKGNVTSKGKAARIFSCRADGSDVQVHCGGGMDNPVEIDFTPSGEMLGTVNLFYRQRGDCLVHWMRGGVYPRHDQQACIDEFPRTGDPLREAFNLGHVAVSGMCRLRYDAYEPVSDQWLVTEFNTHRVMRLRVKRTGSTFAASSEPFLVSTSNDFHPTDVLEDADGSILVVDTGGWFRIGCPTSQIAKPEIPGAIYRIRKTPAKRGADPRGLKLDWKSFSAEQLAMQLMSPFFAGREKAIETLALRGKKALPALRLIVPKLTSQGRRNAVWALARMDCPEALALIRDSLRDKDPTVRQAAVHAVGVARDTGSVSRLTRLLTDEHLAVRRQAATALGQIGRSEAVAALLTALAAVGDRTLEHAFIYALIEINDPASTLVGLSADAPDVRRAALIALDQMPSGKLTRDQVAPLLDTQDAALQEAVLEVITARPGWSEEIVGLAQSWLADKQIDETRATMLRGVMLAFQRDATIQQLVSDTLAAKKTSTSTRMLLLEVIARSELPELPSGWAAGLTAGLRSESAELQRQTVATLTSLDSKPFDEGLRRLAADKKRPAVLRAAALGAIARDGGALSLGEFALLTGQLREEVPPVDRLAAADALGSATLDTQQRLALTAQVKQAGSLELPALVRAFEKSADGQVGLKLVDALQSAPGLASLPAARLNKILASYPDKVHTAAKPLIAKLTASTAEQAARLKSLSSTLSGGNPEHGKEIFFSKRTACYACHRIGEEGGNVGPLLTKIGKIRTRRDLLEAVVLPSASLARGFESYSIITTGGRVITGVISRETATALYIRTAQRAEVRIARDQIDELAPSPVSVMPQGLEKTMAAEDLADLLAYLASLKD